MNKKLKVKRVRRYLKKNIRARCLKPEDGVLTIPAANLGIDIFDSITFLTEDNLLLLTADLSHDYPLPDHGAKMYKAVNIVNESLRSESPDTLMIVTYRSSVCLQRSVRINHETQIAEAILHMAALMKKYANALCEEINLLPDDEDDNENTWFLRRQYRKPPSSHFFTQFGDSLFRTAYGESPFSGGAHSFRTEENEDIPEHWPSDDTPADMENDTPLKEPVFSYDECPWRSEKILVDCEVDPRATHLTIPEGVTGMGVKALHGCEHITHLTLPSTITEIDKHDFDLMPNLEHIEITGSELFESIDGVLYRCDREKTLLRYGAGRKDACFYFPKDVKCIGRHAFADNPHLHHLFLPESVWDVGEFAFAGCKNLLTVQFGSKDKLYIRNDAFFSCDELRNVQFSCSELRIEERAFEKCASLTHITLTGLVSIDDLAFLDCSGLIQAVLPDTLKKAGYDCFRGCPCYLRIHCSEKIAKLIPEHKDHIFQTADVPEGDEE